MTRQTDTLTRNHGDHDALAYDDNDPTLAHTCQVCGQPMPGDLITRYPFDRSDAARRHAVEVHGYVVLDEETGNWEVFGDHQAEAQRVLRGTDTKVLLRKAYRITHAMHDARPAVEADLRTARDLITAEVLRRTGDDK